MKIAYVITRADSVGGASIHVRDLARAMREAGQEARVFLGGRGPVTDQLSAAGVPFVSLPSLGRAIHPWRDFAAYFELRRALAEWRPDLVSTHTAKAGWLGRAAAHSLRIPAIHTPHGLPIGDRLSRAQGRVYTIAERIAAPWARAIICVSEAERNLALGKRIAPADKLHVIHNGVRDNGLRASPEKRPVRIISVARLEAPKDHLTLLAALRLVSEYDWEMLLVGDGPLESVLRTQAPPGVKFAGAVADPAPLLADSQMFILSSRSEGFPRSILEAMRAGLPVIASDVGGVRESVADNVSGFVVPPASPAALGEKMAILLKSQDIRQLQGAAGHRIYWERFRFETMLSRTLGLYNEVVSGPSQIKSA